jgi:hypothetical protein
MSSNRSSDPPTAVGVAKLRLWRRTVNARLPGVADWVTISSLATAGGTLVLAGATFASVRSANRAARVAEQSLLVGLRPVLVPARPEDPPQRIDFAEGFVMHVRGGKAAVEEHDGVYYLGMPVRNMGPGLAVLRGWYMTAGRVSGVDARHADPTDFRTTVRDVYVPGGDVGFWQAAVREHDDRFRPAVRESLSDHTDLTIDVLYGDHEGGQRTISRYGLVPAEDGGWSCNVLRHWQLEGIDPRH